MRIRKGMRAAPSRSARGLAAVAATILISAVAACGSAVAQPPQNGTKFAHTVAQASMVYLQVNWRGWIVASNDINVSATEYIPAGAYGPYDAITSCSGFLASASGDIVTAGHCVDANSFYGGKGAVLAAMMATWKHANGQPLTVAEQAQQAQILSENASVEGSQSGSPVNRTVKVTEPAVSTDTYPADVVSVQPFTQGDVALLRAPGIQGSVLTLAQATPENGDSIVASGYPGDVAAEVDSTTPGSYIDGTVSGTQTVNGTPFTQISAQVSAGMSGGPVLNMAGQVVGTVSWAPAAATEANFMTDVGSIRSVLTGSGVINTLAPADRAFRQGLACYFASRYHEAVNQFDQALALQPGLTMAKSYRQKAVADYSQDVNPPGNGMPWWVYVVIGAAVAVLASGAGAVLIRRRRVRPAGDHLTTAAAGPSPPGPMPDQGGAEIATPNAPGGREERLFCPNCGLEHTRFAHYCEHCGQPFSGETPSEHGADAGVGQLSQRAMLPQLPISSSAVSTASRSVHGISPAGHRHCSSAAAGGEHGDDLSGLGGAQPHLDAA
jgi:serine protease Do